MKERPILFSGQMVNAIRDGRKTQTRRVVKPRKDPNGDTLDPLDVGLEYHGKTGCVQCPYGQPGDRLWVKETFGPCAGGIVYRADGGTACPDSGKWRPSIFMPRWASRILLEITAVRVERLQDISDNDAVAEGIGRDDGAWMSYSKAYNRCVSPVTSYRTLWESINGPGSWDANPWVWVIEFKVLEGGMR